MSMEWTADLPTKPGWYWIFVPQTRLDRDEDASYEWIVSAESYDERGVRLVILPTDFADDFDDDYAVPVDVFAEREGVSHWMGPLPRPKPPVIATPPE